MTIIITQISKYGIIQASDSNITTAKKLERTGKKVFPISRLNAALSYTGVYAVQGKLMDNWMQDFILKSLSDTSITLERFSYKLRDALQNEMHKDQKRMELHVHIAGYVEVDGKSHPELWHLTNLLPSELDGGYFEVRDKFQVTEDFWLRDNPDNNLVVGFQNGVVQLYINGLVEGRTSFIMLQEPLKEFYNYVWNRKDWHFRPPASLKEEEAFIRLYIQFVNTLFLSSNYAAPYIGGKVQTYCIPAPKNVIVN